MLRKPTKPLRKFTRKWPSAWTKGNWNCSDCKWVFEPSHFLNRKQDENIVQLPTQAVSQ